MIDDQHDDEEADDPMDDKILSPIGYKRKAMNDQKSIQKLETKDMVFLSVKDFEIRLMKTEIPLSERKNDHIR